jgi:hypothetical protein
MPSPSGHICIRARTARDKVFEKEVLWRSGTQSREMVPNSAVRDWIKYELVSGVGATSGVV